MTEPCSCPAAGFCARHAIQKSDAHWQLCQTKPHYRKAWDEHRLHGQSREHSEREDRKLRIRQKTEENKRFREWCQSMKVSTDTGLGDTMLRLLNSCRKQSSLKKRIPDYFRLHACRTRESVAVVNERYSYADGTNEAER